MSLWTPCYKGEYIEIYNLNINAAHFFGGRGAMPPNIFIEGQLSLLPPLLGDERFLSRMAAKCYCCGDDLSSGEKKKGGDLYSMQA